MPVDALLFVSKRASVAAAALLCVMAGRLVIQAGAPTPASATEVRVGIGH